jgi:signal transduction histidine kinase/DNA-binding response OmpR family regulator
MDVTRSGFQHSFTISPDKLLVDGEVIVLVDDDPNIRTPMKIYLQEHGLAVVEADSGRAFWDILDHRRVALAILDIGLPDINGREILPQIREKHPELAILMLTGVSDLEIALECIRAGADDFLSKPVHLKDIFHSVTTILEKRSLVVQNKKYQEDLENANFRIQLMHQLSLKMNTAYLNSVALDEILQAILVGITANEGLRFNRAFLALFDEQRKVLKGRTAIGPACQSEAATIWQGMGEKQLDFIGIVNSLKSCTEDGGVNRLIRSLEVPASDSNHILIRSANERKSFKVTKGVLNGFDPKALVDFLGCDSFVVVPLYSPSRPLGVIIADNFVTNHPISDSYVSALELFSSQASLAIEHSHLYMDMQKSIAELESVNYELDKNKDMLVEAERYSVLGQMAAQMVHKIRNPITSIGGIARVLAKKTKDEGLNVYVEVMERETSKLEATLEDMFDFVSPMELEKEPAEILSLVRKSLHLLQSEIAKQNILVEIEAPEPGCLLDGDKNKLQKLLVHLLKNAVEAMPNGGRLSVRIDSEQDEVRVAIINTGMGITDEQANRAREPFFTTKTFGTGMGLAMVDRIVSAHGGSFTLQKTDAGTEVIVRLPK